MEDIIIGFLQNNASKIDTIEDAIESVRYTTYSTTKWSKTWGKMTDNQLGGNRYYRVLDSRDNKVKIVSEFLMSELKNIREKKLSFENDK